MRTTSTLLLSLALMAPASLLAQDAPPDELPPDHPPMEAPAPEAPPTDPAPEGHGPPIEGELPPGHPPPTADAPTPVEDPHGHATPMDETMERAFREPRVASADPNPSIPAGQIRIRVVDEHGAPLADQEIQLGIMRQGGDRERTPGRTDATGTFTYTELPTGSGQAYRVNVPRGGATYSSTPFQLPTAIGYDVRVQTQQTVRSDRSLLLVLGQTMLELRDERIHVIQQARLSNLAAATYLFPEGGTRIELPEGYLSFQTQPVMTDQRVVELAGEGVRIEGSLPTGQVTLAWAFDLPVTGSEMDIEIPNPFRTFQYRVISTAPRGMSMDVEGMPQAVRFEDQGQPLLGTEIQRAPDEPAFSTIHVRLRDIPGPSPARLYAIAVASLLLLGGVILFGRKPTDDRGRAERVARRNALLEEAAELERQLASGEIGPETRQSRRAAIVRELAVLFYLDERLGTAEGTSSKTGSPEGDRAARPKTEGPKRKSGSAKIASNDESEPSKRRARSEESGRS